MRVSPLMKGYVGVLGYFSLYHRYMLWFFDKGY